MSTRNLHIVPLTPERWPLLEAFFGDRGACGGCWCMHWRLSAQEYAAGKGNGNKRRLKKLTEETPPGLLALSGDEAVGWVSLGPRSAFLRLTGSRILKPVDDLPTWSIVCLFIRKSHRRQGLSTALILAASDFAQASGAAFVEAYPVDPTTELADVFAFTGMLRGFLKAGYREVARRSPTRPTVRLTFS